MNTIELAKEAGFELGTAWYGSSKVLERFAALVAEAKDKGIAELYQMCLNQAMTIKKYSDKFGELK